MVRVSNIVAAAFSAALVTGAYAHAAPSPVAISAVAGEALTLTSAKQAVTQQLESSGQRALHPGKATFDSQGNVDVELLTMEGLRVGHMLVHADSGAVTNASSASKPGAKG
jgi:hypothetical protein